VDDRTRRQNSGNWEWPTLEQPGSPGDLERIVGGRYERNHLGQHCTVNYARGSVTSLFFYPIQSELRDLREHRRLRHTSFTVGITIRRVKSQNMAMNDSSSDQNAQKEQKKKPYEKPSFRHEKVFVTTALACGKFSSTQRSCKGNHKVS
jgi:hypothetical protein